MNARTSARGTLCACLLLLLGACATSGGSGVSDCEEDADCAGDLVCEAGECVTPDDPDVGDEDISTVDGGDLGDTDDFDSGLPGEFGDSCTMDADCDSGWCIESPDARVCTQLCNDDCDAEGWECRLVTNTGEDAVRICVPTVNTDCLPCAAHNQCGGFGRFCVEQRNGEFCASECGEARSCAPGYVCLETTVPGAGEAGADLVTDLCQPAAGACAPVQLNGTGVTAISTPMRGDTYQLEGRIVPAVQQMSGATYRMSGGQAP